jgi:predicted transcriptional regulator
MKRTTIFLDEAVERDLQALARQQARPVASLVREAVAVYIATRQPEAAARPAFIAMGRSGRSDVAEQHEELLWKETVPTPHPTTKRRSAAAKTRKRK